MKINALFLLSLATLGLVGCAPRGESGTTTNPSAKPNDSTSANPTGKGYVDGIRVAYAIHGNYLIRAEVQIKDEIAQSVHFDEVVFCAAPDSSGNSIAKAAVQAEGDNVVNLSGVYYAKYLTVGGVTYTGTIADGKLSYKHGNDDYDAISKAYSEQKDRAKLYNTLVTNYAYGSNANGVKIDGLIAPIYSKASEESSYWLSGTYGLGWKANISKIEAGLTGKNLSKIASEYKKASDSAKSKTGFVDSVDTGATISSFNAYVQAAKSAFTGESRVVEQFGLDHQNCFSKTELVVGKDNKVVYANINETNQFLSRLAKRPAESGNDAPVVHFHTDATDKAAAVDAYYSQYISVNGKIWTGTPLSAAKSREYVAYANGTDANAREYYASSAYLANNYYNAQFLHQISVVKDANGTASSDKVTYGNKTATKAEYGNDYWTTGHGAPEDVKPENYQTWWKWNIDAVEKAFVGLDFTNLTKDSAVTSKEPAADGHKYVTIGDVQTGATMSETKTYVQFAHEAYGYLVK